MYITSPSSPAFEFSMKPIILIEDSGLTKEVTSLGRFVDFSGGNFDLAVIKLLSKLGCAPSSSFF